MGPSVVQRSSTPHHDTSSVLAFKFWYVETSCDIWINNTIGPAPQNPDTHPIHTHSFSVSHVLPRNSHLSPQHRSRYSFPLKAATFRNLSPIYTPIIPPARE
ncbi:hypothetical protein K439DRAFT_1634868 [Ramaria rubella]|nr:hypothetical protein K439DRAFT_1634868 [Ramaria rubella]